MRAIIVLCVIACPAFARPTNQGDVSGAVVTFPSDISPQRRNYTNRAERTYTLSARARLYSLFRSKLPYPRITQGYLSEILQGAELSDDAKEKMARAISEKCKGASAKALSNMLTSLEKLMDEEKPPELKRFMAATEAFNVFIKSIPASTLAGFVPKDGKRFSALPVELILIRWVLTGETS